MIQVNWSQLWSTWWLTYQNSLSYHPKSNLQLSDGSYQFYMRLSKDPNINLSSPNSVFQTSVFCRTVRCPDEPSARSLIQQNQFDELSLSPDLGPTCQLELEIRFYWFSPSFTHLTHSNSLPLSPRVKKARISMN